MTQSDREELFDVMIRIAGRHVMEQEVAAYRSADTSDVTFSPEFERKMQRLIRGIGRKERNLRRLRTAFLVAALAALLVGTAMAVPAVRERIINTWIEWTGRSADFHYSGAAFYTPQEQTAELYAAPVYLPEGYREIERWDSFGMYSVLYQDGEENSIDYSRAVGDTLVSLDSEHSDYEETELNGAPLHVFRSTDPEYPSHVVMEYGGEVFTLTGYPPAEELIRMLESLWP